MESAAPGYKDLHQVDPSCLLLEEYMSDEASGPEDDSETLLQWKRRIAVTSGNFSAETLTDSFLDTQNFREVIKPNWRSAEV